MMENEKVWDLQSAKTDYENSRIKNKLNMIRTCNKCKFFRIRHVGLGQTFPWCDVKSKISRVKYCAYICKYFTKM